MRASQKSSDSFEKISRFGERVLEKAKKVFNQVEVIVESGVKTTVWFKDGQLDNIEKVSDAALGLRVIDGKGRLGITGCLGQMETEKLLEEAKMSAEVGERVAFSFSKTKTRGGKIATCDGEVVKTSVEKVVADGQMTVEQLKSWFPDFNPKYAIASWSWGSTRLINSFGVDLTKQGTTTNLFAEVIREKEGDFYEVGVDVNVRRWEKDFSQIAQEVKKRVDWGKRIMPLGKEPYMVIFPPEMAETLLEYVEEAVNAWNVNDKASRLVGKLGEKLFDSRLAITDSALEDWRPGSGVFDDEGVLCGRLPLVERGVLRNFIYDLREAGKAGVKSTGSGERSSVFSGVAPEVHNLVISGGSKPWSQILKGIKRGILLYGFVGAGQGNMLNGDFSLGVQLGYLVHDGEIVGRVKGLGIAGNVFELFKNGLIELSRETEWHGNICSPYIVVDRIKVTRSG
jgi:PmbA protein